MLHYVSVFRRLKVIARADDASLTCSHFHCLLTVTLYLSFHAISSRHLLLESYALKP